MIRPSGCYRRWPIVAVSLLASLQLVAAAVQAPTPQPPPVQPPAGRGQQGGQFRAGVELVSLNVTVTDGAAHYVTDLTQPDFAVYEDGVKQDVTFFNRTNLPIALALLLDTSASMDTKLPTAQEAAVGFARRLRPQDLAEVIDFDSRVMVLQNFTNNAADLETAIHKTSAGGSTSLYNAVYIALKDLKKVVAKNVDEIRRQAIVLLSDGEDTSSLLPFEEVLDLAKRSETAIFAIGLRSDEVASAAGKASKRRSSSCASSRRRPAAAHSFRTSSRISRASTARSPTSSRASTRSATRRGIRKHDGSWRRVVVRVNRPSLTARTKQGYFAPTSH